MAPLAAYQTLMLHHAAISPRDRVQTSDGRVGEVIGFYRTEEDLVLVGLEGGECKRFPRGDLRLLD